MNKNELLRFAVTQNQFIKGYDEKSPRECYNKVLNSYRQLYDKVVNYCVLSDEKEQIPVQTSSTWEKKGNWTRTNEWRKYRNTQIIKLYKEAKDKHASINSELLQNIAHSVGSTLPKVKQVISEYEFMHI